MSYDKFIDLTSTAVPLPIENVDTDQIIPARFLKQQKGLVLEIICLEIGDTMKITTLGKFVLNNKSYSGKILIAGKNFGSGSSREHAAWAIYDYGFRCVISSFFC